MQTARRLIVASLVSVAMLAAFVWLVGVLSPTSWEARARRTTTATEAAVIEQLLARESWEARRGPAASWSEVGEDRHASWTAGDRTQSLVIRTQPHGVMLEFEVGAVDMEGQVLIEDVGERRVVVWTQGSTVGSSPIARFVARFASGQVAIGLDAELSELVRLAEGRPAPEEVPGVARGRVLDVTWPCGDELCSVVRLVDPLVLAGTDVRVAERLAGEEACVHTPWPPVGEGVLPEAMGAPCEAAP